MTNISQLDRKRPRPELDSPSGPPGSPRPAPPAGTLPRAPDGPPGLDRRRALVAGGTPAPRAALPMSRTPGTSSQRGIPRSTTARAESTEPTLRGVKLEHLPPVPRIRDPAAGWHGLWRNAATRQAFDDLRLQYQDTLPPPKAISGALFLRQVNELTGAPGTQAFTTSRADTTRFTVRIPGVDGPVHLLRRDAEDGTLGDLVRLNTGSDAEIKEALAAIAQRSGRRRKARVKQEPADAAAARAALPGVPPNKFFQSQVQGKAHRQIVDPMLRRYVDSTGQATSRPAFVEKVFLLTASAPRLATDRPDIGHFVVNVPGTAEPVHVLRQETHDGMLANFKIVESGDPGAVKRAVNAMYEVARVTASRTQYKIASNETKQREFPPDLDDAYEAFQSRPENLNIARTTFLQLLGQWAGKTAGRKTEVEGIERFTVEVPHYGTVELLGHRAESGEVVHVQRLVSEGELKHKLRRMVQNAKNSRGGATHDTAGVVRHGMREETRVRNNIWRTLQRQMQGEFTRWNQPQAGYKPGSRAFVAHLERLCAESAGEAVAADDSMSVTRHVVTPNPGGPSFTMLRCTNAAGAVASLRVIDELQTEEQAIAAMTSTVALQAQVLRVKGKGTTRRVLAEELDQTVPKKREDAKTMQRALEGMLANKHAGKANLLDGLDDEAELRTWFREDGSLLPKRTAWSFMGMAGFPAARDAMESLLTRLGHQAVVAAMPPRMDAGLLAKVLKARVEHPEASADELMKVIGVPAAVYSRFVSLKTGKLWDPDRIRHLPGYEEHWTEIQDALDQLGHKAQAARQGGVVTDPAKRLAHDIEDDLYALQKALVMMRKEGLSRGKAARRAGVANPALMRVLADKQGNVRNLQFIAGRLSGDPSQKTMDRLGRAVRQLSDLAERDMVVRTLKGGLRVDKLFVVGITAARTAGGAKTRSVRELYADNPELVRKPRSYAAERPRQTLRWLATALRRWAPNGSVEIQTYYDPVKKEVWVSSNKDGVNEQLREFLSTGGLAAMLDGLETAGNHGQRKRTNRTYRHLSKLKDSIDNPALQGSDEAKAVLNAIAAGRFRVPPPPDKPKDGRPPVNLHSELRIRDAVLAETGQAPDPLQLAGTRRPCGTCAKDLDLPDDARRGPFWMSAAARVHHDPRQVADENAKAGIPTFITETRDGRLTEHPNTDSESDFDEPSMKRRAEPARTEPPAKRPAREDGGSAGGAGPVPGRTTAAPAPAPAASGRPQATAGSASGGPGTSSASATLGKRHADGHRVASAAPTPQPASAAPTPRPASAAPAPQAASAAPAPQAASDLAAAASLAEADETQIQALQEDALDAAMLLDRQVDFPVPREEIGPLLQGLLDEGARRFDAFRARLDANPDARATPEQQDEMRQLGELGLRLRRSAAALGWLPRQAAPTAALPAGVSPPADGNWERPMRDLFIPGTASGARNICWFDTLAQLALDQSRDLGGDMRPVDELAAELRETADRLGLTEAGAMADDDHGALQLIAHALGLQVHVFLRQPDGQVALSPLQSVGALEDRPVHVYSDDTHFEPMWPAWEQER
jgi:hypothetical protein